MKKSNRLILLVTTTLLICSFIPTIALAGRVTERPLEDWLTPNYEAFPWGEQNWAFSDFVSPYSWLVCKMGFPWPCDYETCGFGPFIEDLVYENGLVDGVTVIGGKIKERELSDGTALITLSLDVKNAPLTVFDYFQFIDYCFGDALDPMPLLGEGIDGYINYKLELKFIIPKAGDPLPDVWSIWDNYVSCNVIGTGYGLLTEHAVELGFAKNVGALGMLKLHQICLYKPDLKVDHPKYDPIFGDLWPIETVEIFELN